MPDWDKNEVFIGRTKVNLKNESSELILHQKVVRDMICEPKKANVELILHQKVVRDMICEPKKANVGMAVLLKHILFLANQTIQIVAALISSIKNLSFMLY